MGRLRALEARLARLEAGILAIPDPEEEASTKMFYLHMETWFLGGSLEDIPEKDRDSSLWEFASRSFTVGGLPGRASRASWRSSGQRPAPLRSSARCSSGRCVGYIRPGSRLWHSCLYWFCGEYAKGIVERGELVPKKNPACTRGG